MSNTDPSVECIDNLLMLYSAEVFSGDMKVVQVLLNGKKTLMVGTVIDNQIHPLAILMTEELFPDITIIEE